MIKRLIDMYLRKEILINSITNSIIKACSNIDMKLKFHNILLVTLLINGALRSMKQKRCKLQTLRDSNGSYSLHIPVEPIEH